MPAPPKGGVVVLGNYFLSAKTYERVRAAELGGLIPPTIGMPFAPHAKSNRFRDRLDPLQHSAPEPT